MGEIVFQNGDYYRGHWTNDNMTDGFGKFTCETRKTNIPKHLVIYITITHAAKVQPKVSFYFISRSGWHRLLGRDHRGEYGIFYPYLLQSNYPHNQMIRNKENTQFFFRWARAK